MFSADLWGAVRPSRQWHSRPSRQAPNGGRVISSASAPSPRSRGAPKMFFQTSSANKNKEGKSILRPGCTWKANALSTRYWFRSESGLKIYAFHRFLPVVWMHKLFMHFFYLNFGSTHVNFILHCFETISWHPSCMQVNLVYFGAWWTELEKMAWMWLSWNICSTPLCAGLVLLYLEWHGVRVRVWPLKGTSVFTTRSGVMCVSLLYFATWDSAHRLIFVCSISQVQWDIIYYIIRHRVLVSLFLGVQVIKWYFFYWGNAIPWWCFDETPLQDSFQQGS